LDGDRIELLENGHRHVALIQGSSPLRIHQGIFWTDLTLHAGQADAVKVDGIPNRYGSEITSAIEAAVVQRRIEAERRAESNRKATRRERLQNALARIEVWRQSTLGVVGRARAEHRWITQEQVRIFTETKPQLAVTPTELAELLADADVRASLGRNIEDAERAIGLWTTDIPRDIAQLNEEHTVRELAARKPLFDRVESKPLTEEQARAVVCFDNRVQVVASAGSGKTSTMVAKAAYAIQRGFVPADRIVLLAFNGSAVKELEARATRSLKSLGMDGVAVTIKTHALGLDIIGQATGRMPAVPKWVSDDALSLEKLGALIDGLKDADHTFRTRWDLFRLVFGRDVAGFGKPAQDDDWDPATRQRGQRTLNGEMVKSSEERVIADWLFYNGVTYLYERDYEFDTATAEHPQYRPDFFYPDLNVYHEHYALNGNGQPPPEFRNYQTGVRWKRSEHERRGTVCIETTSHQLWTGQLFTHLARQLEVRGTRLDPNPDRPLPEDGKAPMEHRELVELVRTFICHAKSNGLSHEGLNERLRKMPEDSFTYRHRLFLQLVQPIREAWDAALAADRGIDYEDMLNQAADHLEHGRYDSPYELVLADEFQDASWARARLCLALVKKPGRYLFAVGDDWQSINRFAGADVSVMTGFQDWCGQGQVLRLERTFRCPQKLCDASSHFVSKNPAQIQKKVRSSTPEHGPVLQAFQVSSQDEIQGAIHGYLSRLHQALADGQAPSGRDDKVTVFVLGRYNNDAKFVPSNWRKDFGRRLTVEFMTVHSSKGSEADYVVLPGLVRRGFPNLRRDDPVLSIAMPGGDPFHLAEERRLFYVALTRARRSVAMFTVRGKSSVFLDELVADGSVIVTDTEGEPVRERRCPACKRGVLVQRTGRFGPFLGCTYYPKCRHTA
jgi:DNA helicase-4